MKTKIIVNLQFAAIHRWPDCEIPEVAYLKEPHRHIFYICCKKEVNDLDREIEIITFKQSISEYLATKYYKEGLGIGNFSKKSCEMIATELLMEFELCYCSVLEDNENGAEVEI